MKIFNYDIVKFYDDEALEKSIGLIPQETDVQLMKVGTFSYAADQDMKIDSAMFNSMISNFQNKVRGIDIAVDYSHENDKKAAGWVTDLYITPDQTQLRAKIKWTIDAQEKISKKLFRYISAEFVFNYVDDNNINFGPTLYGACLTNRPFLKNMEPIIALSEQKNQGEKMEEVTKLNELLADQASKLSEVEKQLSEKELLLKEMEQKEVERIALELSEKKIACFEKLLFAGKAVAAQRESYLNNDTAKFAELAQPIKLDNIGNSSDIPIKNDESLTSDEAEDKIHILAEKMKEEKRIAYADAVSRVIKENPILNKKYQEKFN